MNSRKGIALGFVLSTALAAGGCGGTEPLAALNQGGALPALSLPLATTDILSLTIPFSQSGSGTASDGFDIRGNAIGLNVISPGPGVVSYVDLTAGNATVYIVHSLHLMSRMSGMQVAAVQAGALVQAGSGIGTVSATTLSVHFTTFYDNAIVCPVSFLAYAAQSRAVQAASGVPLCL